MDSGKSLTCSRTATPSTRSTGARAPPPAHAARYPPRAGAHDGQRPRPERARETRRGLAPGSRRLARLLLAGDVEDQRMGARPPLGRVDPADRLRVERPRRETV